MSGGLGRLTPDHGAARHNVRPLSSVVTPDTLYIRSECVAQGTGEGGGAQVGGVHCQESQVGRGDL